MASSVPCPNPECGASLVVKAEVIGRRLRCALCGFRLVIRETDGVVHASARDESKETTLERPTARFGRYEIRGKLGAGAFGLVYRAYDPDHGREVALKIPREMSGEGPAEVERFLRESRAVARLDHPHIVPSHECGVEDGRRYFASAFVDGRTLARTIAGRGLGHRLAARVAREMADALQHAHDLGIVHRDVKPSNIMLDRDGRAHLMDFGLARLDDSEVRLTQDGFILGTPSYLAPEQALGKSADAEAACDQYSLGATLYEMLAGHPPFAGPLEVVLFATIHQPPPPFASLGLGVPADLEAICLKTLAKRPSERYANCRELADDLGRWLDREPTLAGRPVEPEPPGIGLEPESILSIRVAEESILVSPRPRPRVGSRPVLLAMALGVLVLAYAAITASRQAEEDGLPAIARQAEKRRTAVTTVRPTKTAPTRPIPTGFSEVIRELSDKDSEKALAAPAGASTASDPTERPRIYKNSIGMSFALISPGGFVMGSGPYDPRADEVDRPAHRVEIRRAFSMGVTEVTLDQYLQVSSVNYDANASLRRSEEGRLPAVNIRLADAVTFCKMLSKKEGLVYRLPTEAEWEYSCRAGSDSAWNWGDDRSLAKDHGWFVENSAEKLQAVGLKRPNAFGLHDMHGNAWEWCQDFGQGSPGYPYQEGLQVDPINTQPGPNRLARGGSYHHGPLLARSASRANSLPPAATYDDLGFRVVCEGPFRDEVSPPVVVTPTAKSKAAESKTRRNSRTSRPEVAAVEDGYFLLYRGGDPKKQGWEEIGEGSLVPEAGGVLLTGGGAGYLAYKARRFGDFQLLMDVRYAKAADESGFFFGLQSLPPDIHIPTPVGYEVELSGDVERPSTTGSVYVERAWFHASEKPIPQRPLGEWNTLGVKVVGRTLEVWVNDKRVKVETLPEARIGFIGLQHWGEQSTVRFRNVRIMAD